MSPPVEPQLKVLFYPFEGAGHINACVGLAQALANRGHRIQFLCSNRFVGQFTKFDFEELLLVGKTNESPVTGCPAQANQGRPVHENFKSLAEGVQKSGLLCGKSSKEKALMSHGNQALDKLHANCIEYHDQIQNVLNTEKPDLIVVDHHIIAPCIVHCGIPWVNVHSSNPLSLYNSPQLPPFGSGFPTNDRSQWNEFDEIPLEKRAKFKVYQNNLLKHFNYPELEKDAVALTSKYLNIYGYPEELDYDDIVPKPENFLRIDAFCRVIPESFEFPVEFRSKIQPDDRLIFVSLGSMGSIDVELMKRLVAALANHPTYKCVVSKGPLGDQYQLPDNMWGEVHLPQTSILPLVDLVITHGGNNTVTETFTFGKPMIVMPLFGDQFDNAQRVQEKGYGLRMDPYKFTGEQLVNGVDQLLANEQVKQKLQKAAKRLNESKSKENACLVMEQLVQKHRK